DKLVTGVQTCTLPISGAIAALKDETRIHLSVERNSEGVEYLTPRLQELGFRVVPTTANFLYLETSEDPTQLAARIQNEGCIVRRSEERRVGKECRSRW